MGRWLGLLALCLLPLSGHAAIIQVFDPGSLGTGPFTYEDFERGWNSFQPGVTYSSASRLVRARARPVTSGGTPSGRRGLSTRDASEAITLTFDTPASAVGMFFGNDDPCCMAGFSAFLDIFDASGLLQSIEVVANMNDFADQFIGFQSDEQVTQVTLRYEPTNGEDYYIYLDDVYFDEAPPPPPGPVPSSDTASLLGLALLVLRQRRLRKWQRYA